MHTSTPMAEAFFNAGLFERALTFSADLHPSWRISCLIELERYEDAASQAALALAEQPEDGELLALQALALEACEHQLERLTDLNRIAASRGSVTGVINLARIYASRGEYAEIPGVLSALDEMAGVRPRHLLRRDLLLLQAYGMTKQAEKACALAECLTQMLHHVPLYESTLILLFLAKHAFIHKGRPEAMPYIQNLHALLATLPQCRLHRAVSHLSKSIETNKSAELALVGTLTPLPEAKDHTRTTLALKGKPILAALFQCIVAGGGIGVDRSDITSSVWGIAYSPSRDDGRIYKATRRLHDILAGMRDPEFQLVSVSDRFVLKPLASGG